MALPPMTLIIVALALITLLIVRYQWLMWQVERYSITASWWVIRTKQGVVVADEMANLWPLSRIMWDLAHWDLRHYIVHQHHYDAMSEWLDGELKRRLTWEELAAECRAHDGASAPESQQPADPSRN